MTHDHSELLELKAVDGAPLKGHVYRGVGTSRPMVVMGCAMGVPQRFYRAFAQYLVERGIDVVTMDYRGIGESRPPGSLRGYEADFFMWAERDFAAYVRWALERAPVSIVGHSFGGQLFGLLDDANKTRGLYTFGTGAGWSGYMPLGERLKVELFWKVLGPASVAMNGFLPQGLYGGEPLPLGAYRDWGRFCAEPDYWFADAKLALQERFDRVTAPVIAVNGMDDEWAAPKSGAVFFSHYKNAKVTLKTPKPSDVGLEKVGHLGYFRPKIGPPFWNDVAAWVTA